jgi:hypothetical protein
MFIAVNPMKMLSIQPDLEAICSKEPEIKFLAQKVSSSHHLNSLFDSLTHSLTHFERLL